MKLYIVFHGEFCTDKPREYMAEPIIELVTTDKNKAIEKVKELKEQISSWDWIENVDQYNDESFEYNNEYDTYGRIGIIKENIN